MYTLEEDVVNEDIRQTKKDMSMKKVLISALKIHALYSDERMRIVESSKSVN